MTMMRRGYKQTEVGVIPEEWDTPRIGDAGQVDGGRQRSPGRSGEMTPYLRVANVFDGYVDLSDILQMPFTATEKLRFLLRVGDILLNEGQSLELVGRSAIYRGEPENCCFQNTLVRFRAFDGTYPEYCQRVFQNFLRTGVFASIALQTTSIAHLGANRFAALRLPLPPLPEQQAIAEALGDADALIEALDALIAKKRDIKQGAMQDLLTGQRRLPGFQGEWERKRLVELGEVRNGLIYSPSDVSDDGLVVLRSSNVQRGAISLADTVRVRADIASTALVEEGDILICVRNGSRDLIGKAAIIPRSLDPMAFGAFMAVFRATKPNFFLYLFQSNIMKRQVDERLGATINQITNGGLKSFEFDIPPTLNEQCAIAAVLSDMDAEIAALEDKLAKARAVKQGMMQVLLTGEIRLV